MSDFTGIPQVDPLFEEAEEATNKQGNRTRRAFLFHADRYLFDFNLDTDEWEQFDTENDASYFGIWLNKSKLRIVEYVEGDLFFTQCDDAAGYDAEIAALCAFHGAGPAFVVIDDKAAVTKYYQDRSTLYIHPPESQGETS